MALVERRQYVFPSFETLRSPGICVRFLATHGETGSFDRFTLPRSTKRQFLQCHCSNVLNTSYTDSI